MCKCIQYMHVLNIPSHTDPADIEVVGNTVYGVGTPDTRQRTTTGGIELKPNLVYSNIAADHGNQTEQNGDPYEQSLVYDYVIP